jgi:hypothetical protein
MSTDALECMKVFLVAYMYRFQFKFGNVCQNSIKQATARGHTSSEVKTIFALKFDS